MSDRWDRPRVLGLAPDAAAATAAAGVAEPSRWSATGCDAESVWGECQGGGQGGAVYQVRADLAEPAFHCSCPSRKVPCKHALALLLLWSDGAVPGAVRPGWVSEPRASRPEAERGEHAARARRKPDPRTAERRERRVDDGLADLDQWLCDQVAHGLAQVEQAPYRLFDDAARRLVDAQAGALAGQVRALAGVPGRPGWPGRLLEEYALLRLLVRAHRRRAELPQGLRDTVRARVGFTVAQEEVLTAGERVRDRWWVTGLRDSAQEQLTTRRVWLRGRRTGRPALVLSFAAPGAALDASLTVGSEVDAELAFYPGAQPLRALVAAKHATISHGAASGGVPEGTSVRGLLGEYAAALARDPWLDQWPAVLARVRIGRAEGGALYAVDGSGDALPLRISDPWRLLAVSGGGPVTLAGEWSGHGLLPLAAWHEEEGAVPL
ncbi:SWIM zinc finger family protein [Actinomadura roseirufa]|uniref:SWIM zinc finger family protein n=1 Tax=Actinomadura roseirufa TaxID=2094049 RepID=UPI001F5FE84B|nr:SWIM zinc finger family protein [Actinomadura roseirufa]